MVKEFRKMARENGNFTYEGKPFVLLQQAYPDGVADNMYYAATAISITDNKTEDGEIPVFMVEWDIIDTHTEDAGFACDWSNPRKVEQLSVGYNLEDGRISTY